MTAEIQRVLLLRLALNSFWIYIPYVFERQLTKYAGAFSHYTFQNMMEQLKDQLAEIVHTKEGSQVAMLCIAHASPKVSSLLIYAYLSWGWSFTRTQPNVFFIGS